MDDREMGMEDIFKHGIDDNLREILPSRPYRLYMFSSMLYSASGVSCWCFDQKGRLINNPFPSFVPFLNFLRLGGCMDYVIDHLDEAAPIILTDPLDMVWLADYVQDEEMIIFVGPVFNSRSSVGNVEKSMRRTNVSMRLREELLKKLERVPVLSLNNIIQYMKMLHYTISGAPLSAGDIRYQVTEDFAGIRKEMPADGQKTNAETMLAMENALLQVVREGNIYGWETVERAMTHVSTQTINTGDQNRDAKNSVIVFVSLCARAAIEGGLSVKIAGDLENYYISCIEKSSRYSDLLSLNKIMLEDFTARVHRCKANPGVSAAIQDCCAYVHTNLRQRIEMSDIAHTVGYTEYYLTKKFYKEMGIRLVDYIKLSRIEEAKILLLTNRTTQQISDELQFSSRNYFSKVFREVVGMTPAEYRKNYGKEDRKE